MKLRVSMQGMFYIHMYIHVCLLLSPTFLVRYIGLILHCINVQALAEQTETQLMCLVCRERQYYVYIQMHTYHEQHSTG